MSSGHSRPDSGEFDENSARANIYALIAGLLSTPPSSAALAEVAGYEGDDSELGTALSDLAKAAADTTADAVEEEFNALFIGVSEGEVIPFASHYLTGFLNDAPLLAVRETLQKLGIERDEAVKEPEDQLAFLFEVMAGLLNGSFDVACEHTPNAFFDDHLRKWVMKALDDIATAPSAVFYKPVAILAKRFIDIEIQGFRMAA